jgi:hypothetical protein
MCRKDAETVRRGHAVRPVGDHGREENPRVVDLSHGSHCPLDMEAEAAVLFETTLSRNHSPGQRLVMSFIRIQSSVLAIVDHLSGLHSRHELLNLLCFR